MLECNDGNFLRYPMKIVPNRIYQLYYRVVIPCLQLKNLNTLENNKHEGSTANKIPRPDYVYLAHLPI